MLIRLSRLVALVLGATFCFASSSLADSKLDHVTRALALRRGGIVPVIITTTSGSTLSLGVDLRAHGDRVHDENPLTETVTADVHSEDLARLARDRRVRVVSVNAVVRASGSDVFGALPRASYTGDVNLLRATLGLTTASPTGAGIGVALIDSGLRASKDFMGRISGFFDLTRGGILPRPPSDDYGHGTHVAGLIGSSGSSSNGLYMGVAPSTHFLALKVLDKDGVGQTSDVIRAIDFAVATRAFYRTRIINLSLGHPIFESATTDPLVRAVERAVNAGLIVVTAAGNFGRNFDTGAVGYAGITSPGNAPSAITVGAFTMNGTVSRADDRVAAFSSRGPAWYDATVKPDVVAPGVDLISDDSSGSTLDNVLGSISASGKYIRLSGTSMAAGVVSGIAALVVQTHSGLSPNAVKSVLEQTAFAIADQDGAPADALTAGAGAVNAAGALTLARSISPSAPFGTSWLTAAVTPATTIDGESLGWSQGVIWGNQLLTGSALYTSEPAWGLGVTWGAPVSWTAGAVLSGDLAQATLSVWSSNIVWGNGLIGMWDGDNIVWGNVSDLDNIVWGNLFDDNIVWGNFFDDNIVWGNGAIVPAGGR